MKSFLSRFGSLLSFVLCGFDRLRFRGESRLLNNGRGVESYLYRRNLRCIDFPKHGDDLTKQLRRQTEQDAKEQGVPLKPLNSGPPLGQAVLEAGQRTARALNPLTGKDGELLRALSKGEFLLKGFRNTDIRVALYGESKDANERRSNAARVTRQLALLRAHGLIVKVTGTHRYHLSAAGRRIVACLLAANASDISRLDACA